MQFALQTAKFEFGVCASFTRTNNTSRRVEKLSFADINQCKMSRRRGEGTTSRGWGRTRRNHPTSCDFARARTYAMHCTTGRDLSHQVLEPAILCLNALLFVGELTKSTQGLIRSTVCPVCTIASSTVPIRSLFRKFTDSDGNNDRTGEAYSSSADCGQL
jgi:hypothetical protein